MLLSDNLEVGQHDNVVFLKAEKAEPLMEGSYTCIVTIADKGVIKTATDVSVEGTDDMCHHRTSQVHVDSCV